MHAEFNRLIILLQAVYDQGSMVHKDPKMRNGLKQRFNNFDLQIKKLMDDIHKAMGNDQAAKDYLEQMSVIYNETLRQVEKCKDPQVALAVLSAINEGCEVTVDGVTIKDYQPEKKMEEFHLCRCNNCDEILIDYNPQTGAKKHKIDPDKFKELEWKVVPNAVEDSHWVCPNCQTDEHLSDEIKNYQPEQKAA